MAEMFDDLVRRPPAFRGQKWYTLPLSIVVHAGLIGVLVVVPLMAADVIATPKTILIDFVVPEPPTMPPLPPPPTPPAQTPQVQPTNLNPNIPPTEAPRDILPEVTIPPLAAGVPGIPSTMVGVSCAPVPGGGIPCLGGSASTMPIDIKPPVPAKPLPIGGQIREPVKIRHVNPVYPQIAQNAKISGVVILEAVIGADGNVTDVKVLRSIPMLDAAALAAVRQWKFRPTLLNGTPVAVVMTVTVNFHLQ